MFLKNRKISAFMLAAGAMFSAFTVSALAAETTGTAEAASSGLPTWLIAVIIAAVVVAAGVIVFFTAKSRKANAVEAGTQKNQKKTVGEKLKKFWRDYKSEMKKITWSPWKSVKKNTIIVLFIIIVLSAVIGLFDYLFSNGMTLLGRIAG